MQSSKHKVFENSNSYQSSVKSSNYNASDSEEEKYINKALKNFDYVENLSKLKNVNLDDNIKIGSSNKIDGEIKNIERQDYNRSLRIKDRADRATVEQVIDARISKILYKLINKGEILEINGCVSTGKEANVYHGRGAEGKELALKIYKTSILIFKDRDRYISGEFRFRHGYCKGNPRKMVALWAEKEVRNLKRLQISGINSPVPLILKSNLIVMEFIGKNGIAAPRLKDAEVEDHEEWEEIYLEIILILRKMFKECKLVHADFSEYNILYYEKKIYIIDVAQAVEDFHPNALSFLKRDCHNINVFFDKNGVETILDQQLFEIVSGFDSAYNENINEYIIKLRQANLEKTLENKKYKETENGLFINFEIPRSLQEEDVDKITGNYEIEEALSKLCGIVKKENETKLIVPKRNEKGHIVYIQDPKDNVNPSEIETKNFKEANIKNKNKIFKEQEHNRNENHEKNKHEIDNKQVISNKDENEISGNISDEDNSENDYNIDDSEEEDVDNIDNRNDVNENDEEDTESGIIKNKKFDPFGGMTKQERKKKVKEENREKRANKKMTKYEKQKAVKKSSGKR